MVGCGILNLHNLTKCSNTNPRLILTVLGTLEHYRELFESDLNLPFFFHRLSKNLQISLYQRAILDTAKLKWYNCFLSLSQSLSI